MSKSKVAANKTSKHPPPETTPSGADRPETIVEEHEHESMSIQVLSCFFPILNLVFAKCGND